MIQKLRVKFEPVRVNSMNDTEGKPAQMIVEASAVADAADTSLHHDKLWKTPGPRGTMTLEIHQPEAMELFQMGQPFYAELHLEDGKEAPPSKTGKSAGKKGMKSPKKSSKKSKTTARSKGSTTGSPSKRPVSKTKRPSAGSSRPSSRSKPKSSKPSSEMVKQKTAGSRTSAPQDKPQPVTNPGGNE